MQHYSMTLQYQYALSAAERTFSDTRFCSNPTTRGFIKASRRTLESFSADRVFVLELYTLIICGVLASA